MGGIDEKDDLDEDGIVKRVNECRKEAKTAQAEWRDEAKDNYDMVACKQWAPEDAAAVEEQGRVAVVFNRLGTIIDAVAGSEVNNRQEVRYIPREIGDVATNEVLTSAAQWVRDNCDAEDEESDAFVDVLIAGVGFTETRMDYEEDENGQCIIERVDPLEVRWDPTARKRNLADAKWIQRERGFTRKELESRWPEADVTPKEEFGEGDEPGLHEVSSPDGYDSGKAFDGGSKKLYQVIQHQWYETECVYKVLSPDTGQIIDVPEEQFEQVEKVAALRGIPLKSAKIRRRKYLQAFVCGETMLEVGPAPCSKDFSIQAITGRRDRNAGTWYGLVRPMKDPQRWANKFLSTLLHIISSNAKGGLMVEKGAVDNPRKFEREWAKAESISMLNPGGIGKIQAKQPPIIPPAISELMNFSISSIRDTSGVSLELLGMADREQAGYLEAQRTKAGLTILAGFFDALRLYRKRQGRVLAHFIFEYIPEGTLIKVIGKMGESYVPLTKSPEMMQFDTVVDSAPTSRDMKEKTFAVLNQMLPMLQQSGIPLPAAEIIEYSPLPSAMVAAWKQLIEQSKQPNPTQQAMEQLSVQQAAADVEKTQATADKEQTAATLNAVKAQVESLQPMIQQLQMMLSAFSPAPGPGGQQGEQQPPPGGFFTPQPAPTPFQ